MRKETIAIAIILVVIMVSGAQCNLPGTKPTENANTANSEYHTGTKGLEMSFMKGSPPKAVYDLDQLELVIELMNKGTYELSDYNTRLVLSGYDPYIIVERYGSGYFPTLEPKSVYNPEGGYGAVSYQFDVFLPEGVDVYDPKIVVTACYQYETTATPIICIDPGLYRINVMESVCKVGTTSDASGQGAPVAVTSIETEMMSAGGDAMRAQFTINIENKGGGKIVPFAFCPSMPPSITEIDRVFLQYVRMSSGQDITSTCQPVDSQGTVKLHNGKARIICNTEGFSKSEPAFNTPLNIKLIYDYMNSIDTKITIKKTPN